MLTVGAVIVLAVVIGWILSGRGGVAMRDEERERQEQVAREAERAEADERERQAQQAREGAGVRVIEEAAGGAESPRVEGPNP